MRTLVIFVIQLVLSVIVTASVMPFVLVTTPAAQTNPRLGLALMGGILLVCFTLVALAWPRRLR